MYFADCHTHTRVSPDSRAELIDMARAARAAGLQGLWATDHCDLLNADGEAVDFFDWPAAFSQMDAARAGLGDALELRLGLELGSAPHSPLVAEKILAGGGERLDFVLGSLHNWIGARNNGDFYFTDYSGDPALCRAALENALDSTWALVSRFPQCYDSLAHIIYPMRYIERDGQSLSLDGYEGRIREILKEVARTGHALELNTCRGRDIAPWAPILRWFRECGGRYVTLGSDAHRPEDVAAGLREGAALVEAAGFEGITVFRGRRPQLCRWKGEGIC